MNAYFIAEIEITNPERYQDYTTQTPAIIEKHGGRFIVRGGNAETLEGIDAPARMVIIAFSSKVDILNFYYSDEYQAIIHIRQEASKGRIYIVEGLETTPLD